MDVWLRSKRVETNGSVTNQLKKEQYKIPDADIASFWLNVCELASNGTKFSLSEIVKDKSNISAIFHLQYSDEEETPLPSSFIRSLIYAFQKSFRGNLNISSKQMLCAVSSCMKNELEHYLLLQFPLFQIDVDVRDKSMSKSIVNAILAENPTEHLHSQPVNNYYENIFDTSYPIYGSIYPKSGNKFTFDRFYGELSKEDIFEDQDELAFKDVFHRKDSQLVQSNLVSKNIFKDGMSESTNDTFSTRSGYDTKKKEEKLDLRSASRDSFVSMLSTPSVVSRVSEAGATHSVDYWLPFFLSITFSKDVLFLKRGVNTSETEQDEKPVEENREVALQEIVDLCKLVSSKLIKHEPYLSIIGRICWHTSRGSDEGFDVWKSVCEINSEESSRRQDFNEDDDDEDGKSEKSENASRTSSFSTFSKTYTGGSTMEEDELETMEELFSRRPNENPDFAKDDIQDPYKKIWHSFRTCQNCHYTIKSLHFLAYSLNKEKYRQHIIETSKVKMGLAVSLLDSYIADLFVHHYQGNFIYDPSKKAWLYYQDHKWWVDKQGLQVRKYISGPFRGRLEATKKLLVNKVFSAEKDKEKIKENAKCEAAINTLIGKCLNDTYKNKLKNELMERYVDPSFNKFRDENPNLLGMKNGILHIVEDKIYHRKGLPEDYITLSTRINYIPLDKLKKDVRVKHVRVYFAQLFPDPSLRRWVRLHDISLLRGGTIDKNIFMGIGGGDNSKSGHIRLKELAFGDYYLCGKNESILADVRANASGPEPEKILLRGKRIVVYLELDGKCPLQGGALRKMSGGDNFGSIRDGHQFADDIVGFSLMPKTELILNKLPPIAEGGSVGALWEKRLKVVKYSSKWIESAPTNFKEQWEKSQFKLDDDFMTNRLPEWAEIYFSMLVHGWKFYWNNKPKRLPDCAAIIEETKRYRQLTDLYLNYYDERIVIAYKSDGKTIDTNAKVSVAQLYSDFKIWFNIQFSKKFPPRNIFLEEMRAKGLIHEGDKYVGIAIKKDAKKKLDEAESDEEKEEKSDEEE